MQHKTRKNKFFPKKEGNTVKEVWLLSTWFVEKELYQMSMVDKFYPVLLALTVASLFYFGKNDLLRIRHLYYVGAIVLCTIIAYYVQIMRVKKEDRRKRVFKFNKKQVGMMFVNLVVLIIPTTIYRNNGGSWETLFNQLLTAFWETGTFGISIVFALLVLTRFARKNAIMETGFFAVIIGLSTLAFTFAHIKVYGLDPFRLSFLFVFGYGFNFITYAFNPSLGIGLHYLNNILVFNKLIMVN